MNPSHDLQGLKKKAKETFLYVLSALLLGIAIGAIDAVFGRVLLFITDFRSAHDKWNECQWNRLPLSLPGFHDKRHSFCRRLIEMPV